MPEYYKFNPIDQKPPFAAKQNIGSLGSLLPFAARCTNVRLEAKL